MTPGSYLGVYEIVGPLGAGGMGEVYRARDSKLQREVAIKVLPESFAADPERLSRFEREARVLASLNHLNIAHVYGLEQMALVMELVEGPTLADRIAAGAIPLEEALPIATQIAEALEAAHEQGIVHRDLKPANIKVRSDGTVKVLDFGLAKLTEPVGSGQTAEGSGSVSMAPTLASPSLATGAGMILGTAPYMSPEQAKGRPADRRADLWSFGCVLYEMLTGRRLFDGEDVAETLAAVLRAEPDWNALPSATPLAVKRLLRLCLERDPKKRLHSAADARLRLAEAAEERPAAIPSDTTPVARLGGAVLWQAIAGVLTLAVIGLVVASSRVPAAPELPETRSEIITPSTPDPNSFAISPDGRQIAFVAAAGGTARLWVRSLATTTATPLPDTDGAVYPFWSPDGRSIAFFADNKLRRLDFGATRSTPIADVIGMRGGAWSPDGTILFAGGTAGPLLRVPAGGGTPQPVGALIPGQTNSRFPAFLRDGRRFVYFAMGSVDVQGIYLGSLDSPEATRLVASSSAGIYVRGNWLLWVRGGVLVAQKVDPDERKVVGDLVTVTDQLTYEGTTFVPAVSASGDGTLVYRTGAAGSRELRWFDRQGKSLGALGMPDDYVFNPRLSPDGTRALAVRTVEGNSDVWLLDGARSSRMTISGASEQFPVWSPDGNRFAYRSNANGTYDLFVAPTGQAGQAQPLVQSARDKVPSGWSSDGRYLAYQQNDETTGWNVWVTPLDGSRKPFVVIETAADEGQPTFSPDGRWLAYRSNQSGRYEVYVRRFVTPDAAGAAVSVPQWQVSADGALFSKWRADGKALYFQALNGVIMEVPLTIAGDDARAGTPLAVVSASIYGTNDINLNRNWDVADDGRILINTVRDTSSSLVLIQHWKAGR